MEYCWIHPQRSNKHCTYPPIGVAKLDTIALVTAILVPGTKYILTVNYHENKVPVFWKWQIMAS